MKYSKQIWDQLRNVDVSRLVRGLEKSGWVRDKGRGNIYVYRHPNKQHRITIHYHPKKTYGPNLLKSLFEDIDWSENDLRKLKLIK